MGEAITISSSQMALSPAINKRNRSKHRRTWAHNSYVVYLLGIAPLEWAVYAGKSGISILYSSSVDIFSASGGLERFQKLQNRDRREFREHVRHRIRDHKIRTVFDEAARINDIRHIPFALERLGPDQRLARARQHDRRILSVEQPIAVRDAIQAGLIRSAR